MRFEGSVEIKAPRDWVFAFLVDPERMGGCLPKVQSIKRTGDGRFEALAKVGKGLFSASFVLTCEFTEVSAPDRAAVRVQGKAKGSSVDGAARMTLRDLEGGGTAVDWVADVTISGMVARIGEKRIAPTAERMIGQTFNCVRKKLKAAGGQ